MAAWRLAAAPAVWQLSLALMLAYVATIVAAASAPASEKTLAPERWTKCQLEVARASHLPGDFVPRCNVEDGRYKAQQCDADGRCWCVNPSSGARIPGTLSGPEESMVNCNAIVDSRCHMELVAAWRVRGAFIPDCGTDGLYRPRQCDPATGVCWCVNVRTGVQLPNSRTPPGYPELAKCKTTTLCQDQATQEVAAAYRPSCDAAGLFKRQQCQSTTTVTASGNETVDLCWCVEPETGEMLAQTRTLASDPVNCDAYRAPCELQRAQIAAPAGAGGWFRPRCARDGSFAAHQCHPITGFCYCVHPHTGAIIRGTDSRPGEAMVSCPANATLCQHQALTRSQPLLCEPRDGSFQATQCQGGRCWCVNINSGLPLPRTEVRAPRFNPPVCKAEQTACELERVAAAASKAVKPPFMPTCLPNGLYAPRQCNADDGYCWCVRGNDGSRIRGSVTPPGSPLVECLDEYPDCSATPCPGAYECARRQGDAFPSCLPSVAAASQSVLAD